MLASIFKKKCDGVVSMVDDFFFFWRKNFRVCSFAYQLLARELHLSIEFARNFIFNFYENLKLKEKEKRRRIALQNRMQRMNGGAANI